MVALANSSAYAMLGKRCAFIGRRAALKFSYFTDAQLADGAGEICGVSPRVETLAARKLRHFSSGIEAMAINASWLIMNPTNHGNAFCMKP